MSNAREHSSELYNVKTAGAVGDGVTDDAAAFNAALAASDTVLVPAGNYLITSPIFVTSGKTLRGISSGNVLLDPKCRIVEGAGFSGAGAIVLSGATQCTEFAIRDIRIDTTTVPAIKQGCGLILNGIIRNITLYAYEGLILDSYTQAMEIDNILSMGSVERLLVLKGNQNYIHNIDKEGNSGTNTEAYVQILAHALGKSSQNALDAILIEGAGSANKSLIKLDGCDATTIRQLWMETSATDGYGVRIVDCYDTVLENYGRTTSFKLKIDTSRYTKVIRFNADAQDLPFADQIEIDATSVLEIDYLLSRRGADTFKLNPNIRVNNQFLRQLYTDSPTGYPTFQEVSDLAGQNLAVNGSFEAGRYGWTFTAVPTTTEEYITSEVSGGLMGHFVWATTGTRSLQQNITVPANVPVTVTVRVKCAAGDAGAFLYVLTSGLGITNSTSYHRANLNGGWQTISRTVVPTSAGSLLVGVSTTLVSEYYIDDFSVSIGTVGVLNQGRFGTLEVGGQQETSASAAPTTGTWRVGDRVWKTAPAAGGTPGWVCTTGGSSGVMVWKDMANLAP